MSRHGETRPGRGYLLPALLAALLLGTIVVGAASALTWEIDILDPGGASGVHPDAVVLDAAGNPHVAYSGGDEDLMYAWFDGADWHTEVVDTDGDIGSDPSLALDPVTGDPRITYTRWPDFDLGLYNGALKYAARDGSTWQIETITDLPYVKFTPTNSDLVLDPVTGYPRFSFDQHGFQNYAAWDGSSWQIDSIEYVEWSMLGPSSLALTPSGDPCIAYGDGRYDTVRFAARVDGEWQVEVAVQGAGWDCSLTLDPVTGDPRIASMDTINGNLVYTAFDGSSWTAEDVSPIGRYGGAIDLALDPVTGDPRIAYFLNEDYSESADDLLRYAAFDGATWQVETFDPDGDRAPFLLPDGLGNPRIVYVAHATGDLRLASAVVPSASCSAVPTEGPAPLTVAFDGSLSSDPEQTALAYAWDFGDGDTATTVAPTHEYAAAGTYEAVLIVTDGEGLRDAASVTITVQTPAEAVSDLAAQVEGYGLPADVDQGLTDKLDAAIAALDRGNERAAVNMLNSFIGLVKAQTGKTLTAAQAEALISEARGIIESV
jgi:hypothetical protein